MTRLSAIEEEEGCKNKKGGWTLSLTSCPALFALCSAKRKGEREGDQPCCPCVCAARLLLAYSTGWDKKARSLALFFRQVKVALDDRADLQGRRLLIFGTIHSACAVWPSCILALLHPGPPRMPHPMGPLLAC